MKTEKEIQDRLAEIKAEQDIHSNALSALAQEKNDLSQELYTMKTGLTIGDKVKFMDGKVQKTGEIIGFAHKWSGTQPVVLIHKSDGSLGTRKATDWRDYTYEKI